MPEPARRLEIFTGAGRRRAWSDEEKAAIVAESLSGRESVSAVARRRGLTPSQLFGWRRQFNVRPTRPPNLMPVVVVPERAAAPTSPRRMEIVSANGRRVIVDAGVDVAALGRVLDLLDRR